MTDLMSSMAVDAQVCEQRGGTGSSRDRRPARISLGGHVGGSVRCFVAATSSGRSGVSASPTGCRDSASATVLRTPGMWITRKRYRNDFSLMFRKRGFAMSSRARSPSTFRSGLWSTATNRSEHPRVKCRALSSASTTASASPGQYLPHWTWRETLEAREDALRVRHVRAHERLSEHTRVLPPLAIGNYVRMQNLVGPYPTKWDRTGIVVEVRQFDQYVVRVDGSGRVTLRNRKHLRQYTPHVARAPLVNSPSVVPLATTTPVAPAGLQPETPSHWAPPHRELADRTPPTPRPTAPMPATPPMPLVRHTGRPHPLPHRPLSNSLRPPPPLH